jgi:hypothetical protein
LAIVSPGAFLLIEQPRRRVGDGLGEEKWHSGAD